MSRIIAIDLTDKSITEESVPAGHYGRGLAMELIRRHSREGCGRLSPDNALAVVPGLLTGCHVPCATRATVAARSEGGFAVSSITGDMPQKLASLGIAGLVIKGRSDSRCAAYIDKNGVSISCVSELDGLSCGEIVDRIRGKYGTDCAVIGTGPAGDMQLPLSGLFTTYPEGTPRFTCPRSSFGDIPGSKNLRAVIVKCGEYFGAECADKKGVIENGKALASLIMSDPICGGALPGLGSITILHLLKNKDAIPELPKRKRPSRPVGAGRLNYCCAPGCVIGCLNRHSSGDGRIFSAPEEAEVRAAMAGCFGGIFSEEELNGAAAAVSARGMALGLNTTEFVCTASMYMELAGVKPTPETLTSLMEEIAAGSITGRLIGGGTAALGRMYPDDAGIQKRVTMPANTGDSKRRLSLHRFYPELGDMTDLELLYRQIFIMENLGLCIFSSFALINRPEAMELMAGIYGCRTGKEVTPAELLRYAGECLAEEERMARSGAAVSVRRSIPEFVKVLYRYFGKE